MRYTHSRQESAEHLRAAIANMGQHDAAFDPLTFAVWYEIAAAMNARLSKHLLERLSSEPRLSDETIKQLYVDYIAEPDDAAVRNIAAELHKLMSGITQAAAETGELAGSFRDTLSGLADALGAPEDRATLATRVDAANTGTAGMQESVEHLRLRLEDGQSEILALRAALRREREQSLLDPLTQVLNRKGFDLKLQTLLNDEMEGERKHHLLLIDIDHFKRVNDTYGHVMGDRVLQVLGEILRTYANDASVCAARYGGEEFALIISGRTELSAIQFANAVRERVRSMKIRDRRSQGVLLGITISIGVTVLHHGEDQASTVARADSALYASKTGGRDLVSYKP